MAKKPKDKPARPPRQRKAPPVKAGTVRLPPQRGKESMQAQQARFAANMKSLLGV